MVRFMNYIIVGTDTHHPHGHYTLGHRLEVLEEDAERRTYLAAEGEPSTGIVSIVKKLGRVLQLGYSHDIHHCKAAEETGSEWYIHMDFVVEKVEGLAVDILRNPVVLGLLARKQLPLE